MALIRTLIPKPWWAKMLLVLLAILVGIYVTCYVMVRSGAKAQPTERADCIIVLGAGYERPDGPPMLTYRNRLRHGQDLYEQGMAETIITTELAPCAEKAKEYLVERGVPEDAVLHEDKSRTTWENLVYALEVMEEHDLRSAIIVSDGFHIHRSLVMCKALGIPAQGAATPYSIIEQVAHKRIKYSLRDAVNLAAHAIRRPGLMKKWRASQPS
ncbi:MAG TPA: YdcF family protein [Armatimonadota bacterium]|nr:YdcF family protein [Armatimonadota bacterium]